MVLALMAWEREPSCHWVRPEREVISRYSEHTLKSCQKGRNGMLTMEWNGIKTIKIKGMKPMQNGTRTEWNQDRMEPAQNETESSNRMEQQNGETSCVSGSLSVH